MKKIIYLLAFASLAACAPKSKSDWLMSPPERLNRVDESPKKVSNPETPNIEILFVIDNSKSMDKHIANLSSNIDQFVNALGSNLPFPFHVGVTTVYDSRSALRTKGDDVGALLPVKNEKGEEIPNKYFISSGDANTTELLRNTLKVKPLGLPEGGPEVEEMFTPVAALYGFGPLRQSAETQVKQQGFFMGKSAHKVVFFITDASDNSGVTDSELFEGLKEAAGGDATKILAYGALARNGAKGACAVDPGKPNNKIPTFLASTRTQSTSSNILDLCSMDFGRRLAQVGSQIREQALTRVIHLKDIPDLNNVNNTVYDKDNREGIWVTYGTADQDITKRQRLFMRMSPKDTGYDYDSTQNGIIIDPNFKFDIKPGASLRIEYTAISASNIRHNRVKPWMGDVKTAAPVAAVAKAKK